MEALLTKRQAAAIVGLHPESLMRLTRTGDFPAPIKLGSKVGCSVRFDQAEVAGWIEGRKATR
jgi:predicted DNA-binding transcriptional regulator AlpA